MEIGPVGAELLHADGRTDMVKLRRQTDRHDETINRFSRFC